MFLHHGIKLLLPVLAAMSSERVRRRRLLDINAHAFRCAVVVGCVTAFDAGAGEDGVIMSLDHGIAWFR